MSIISRYWIKGLSSATLAVATFLFSSPARAVELEPFEFVAAPAGTTAFLGYLSYTNNDYLKNAGQTKLEDGTNLDAKIGIARLAHYFNVGDTLALVEVLQPFGSLDHARVAGTNLRRSRGLGDTIFAAAVWPINHKEENTYFGLTLYVTAPTGKYRKEAALNLGGNRFVYDPQLALFKGLSPHWSLELTADWIFYGNNNDAGVSGQQTLKQDPTVQAQAFLDYKFDNGLALSLGYQGQRGGKQHIAGVDTGARTHFDEARVVASKFLTPKFQLMGEFNHQFNVIGGFRQNAGFLLRGLVVF